MKTTSAINLLLVMSLATGSGFIAAQTSQVIPASTVTGPKDDAAKATSLPSGESHVRIVRLSNVEHGGVLLDRNTGNGFEPTMQNMPIVEGARLQAATGPAEVEFEDDSTLRIAPVSMVDFPQLILRNTGATASTVSLLSGTMYISLAGTKNNEFTIKAGSTTIIPAPSTHLRLEVNGPKTTLAVFSGNALVQGPSGSTVVGKKQTLTMSADQSPNQDLVAKNVTKQPYDQWDEDAVRYHDHYTRGNALTNSPYAYGVSDLNYYGSFSDIGGCGMMWQPYFVGAAWNPYSSGLWAWYPGAGYSWVSPYPWGWLPYHSGDWAFCPARGWGWFPSRRWMGLRNTNTGTGPSRPHPPKPPAPPVRPHTNTLAVVMSRTSFATSKMGPKGNFEFHNNSAGLGVPRGSFSKLSRISTGAEQHGIAFRPAYIAPIGSAHNSGFVAHEGPAAIRPGTPNGGERGISSNNGSSSYRASASGSQAGTSRPTAGISSGASRSGGGFSGGGGGFSGGGGGIHGGSGGPSGGSSGGSSSSGASGGGGGKH